jgi:hypothetical protein
MTIVNVILTILVLIPMLFIVTFMLIPYLKRALVLWGIQRRIRRVTRNKPKEVQDALGKVAEAIKDIIKKEKL